MGFATLEDVFLHELEDLYSAETQLIEALPTMAQAAENLDLKKAFEHHLDETQEHAARLEALLNRHGNHSRAASTCKAMQGLIKEGEDVISQHAPGVLRDVAIIAAAQRVEHYEIAGYGTARTLASRLDDSESQRVLQETLNEEGRADSTLTKIAEGSWITSGLNKEAAKK